MGWWQIELVVVVVALAGFFGPRGLEALAAYFSRPAALRAPWPFGLSSWGPLASPAAYLTRPSLSLSLSLFLAPGLLMGWWQIEWRWWPWVVGLALEALRLWLLISLALPPSEPCGPLA